MKPVNQLLVLLGSIAAVGTVSAFFALKLPGAAEASDGARSETVEAQEWRDAVMKELHEIHGEIAALRRDSGGSARSSSTAHLSAEDDWAARVQEAELRLLVETLSRERDNARRMMDQ